MDLSSDGVFENDNVTCVSPWYELRINSNGDYTYCHASKDHEKSSMLPSDWFNNGAVVSKAREQIKHGQPVSGCQQCYRAEQAKLLSHRSRRNLQAAIYSNKYFKHSVNSSPAWNRMNGRTQHMMPSFIHVSLNNVCNMACRMCSPRDSSKVGAIFKKAGLINSIKPEIDWTQDQQKWQNFCDLIIKNPSLICLHFMGGEPMLAKKFHELIDFCIENNAVDFHLTFVTNCTVVNSELLDKLKQFKSVSIEASVENFHHSNDYIRIGGQYAQLKKNIEFLLQHRTDTFNVVLRTVPQALSVLNYDSIIDFAINNNVAIDSNILSRPEYLKIFVLPKEIKLQIKQQLIDKYHDLIEISASDLSISSTVNIRNNHKVQEQLSTHVRLVLTLLDEEEPENIQSLRQDFFEYNKKIDVASNLKFTTTFPSLEKFYNEYCNH